MNKGKNLTDASKGIYASVQGAHRGLQRARIIASDAIQEMKLTYGYPLERNASKNRSQQATPASRLPINVGVSNI
jgi:hypothetical protein